MSVIDYRTLPKDKIIQGIKRLGEIEVSGGLTKLERENLDAARAELLSRVSNGATRIRDAQRQVLERTGKHVTYDAVLIHLANNEDAHRKAVGQRHADEQARKREQFLKSGQRSAAQLSR